MVDFNSKYTGEQVDALLDIVSQGGIGGGGEGEVQKTTETEILAMGFTKNLGTITEVKMNGESKGTEGVVDLGTVLTEHQDISGKQDIINDLEDIREGASKGATALQSIPSEYVTETELNDKGYATTSALNEKVDKVDGKGLSTNDYTTTEKNKLAGLSNYNDSEVRSLISQKVDKVSGKQLSTEDFTSALKAKLEGLSNYDDTTISEALASLQTQLDTLVSGNANNAINSFNEIIAFLEGIKDSDDLSSIIASIEQQIASKYTKPNGGIPASDLAPDVFLQGEKGDKGDKGDTGAAGANGTNGTDGKDGADGATFTPSVDANGNLSWTNNGGLTNPPTVNIKGPKGDSGEGGGGGDSSVFITHFTVSEFTSGNVEFTDEQVEAIRDAARQNKIIALPQYISNTYYTNTGFLVASYHYDEADNNSELWSINIAIIYDNASYSNAMNGEAPYFRWTKLTITSFRPLIEYTSVDDDGNAIADSTNKDNLIIFVEGECRYLQILEVGPNYGMTVRFLTGEDCAIDYWGNWANGVIPTIEPYTAYEMSIVYGADYNPCAVLTSFKPVE